MIGLLALAVFAAEPTPGSAQETAPAAPESGPTSASPTQRRFVYAWFPSLVFGVSPWPSFSPGTLFLGARTKRSWAVGYQVTLSFGLAERYTSGVFTHRHHLTGMRGFGARGVASVGGGVALLLFDPVVECEGRVGVRFGSGRSWVFGGLVRLGWNIAYKEHAPMPQLGIFIGHTTL